MLDFVAAFPTQRHGGYKYPLPLPLIYHLWLMDAFSLGASSDDGPSHSPLRFSSPMRRMLAFLCLACFHACVIQRGTTQFMPRLLPSWCTYVMCLVDVIWMLDLFFTNLVSALFWLIADPFHPCFPLWAAPSSPSHGDCFLWIFSIIMPLLHLSLGVVPLLVPGGHTTWQWWLHSTLPHVEVSTPSLLHGGHTTWQWWLHFTLWRFTHMCPCVDARCWMLDACLYCSFI